MARPIKPRNKEMMKKVTLSYIMSDAKFKYTLTEHRIRFAILDNLKALSGIPNNLEIRNNKFRMHKPQNIHAWEVELPMGDILKYMGSEDTPSKNYMHIEEAAESIQKKIFKVKNTETGDFWAAPLIMNVYIAPGSGIMRFLVADWVMVALLDYKEGFREFEFECMMKLKSPYSMRFYELVVNQNTKEPIPMSVGRFREWMGIENGQYTRTYDLKKWVIEASKKELDKKCPWSFDFQEIKENPKCKTSKVLRYLITPRHIIENEDQESYKLHLQSKVTARLQLSKEAYDYLRYNLDFTIEEINRNKQTFITAEEKIPQFVDFLASLVGPSRLAENPKGYIIGACKKKATETISNLVAEIVTKKSIK